MSDRLPPELADGLMPTDAEARALDPDAVPAWRDAVAAATTPTPTEVARLAPRARRPAPSRLPALALAAAVLLAVLWAAWPAGPPTVVAPALLPADQLVVLAAAPRQLTADATVEGAATLRVLARDAEGAVVGLDEGRAVFEVDPQGHTRHIVVEAGAVRVRVTGTRFSVARDPDRVHVAVERGSVEVRDAQGATVSLAAGEAWQGRAAPPPARLAPTGAPPAESASPPPLDAPASSSSSPALPSPPPPAPRPAPDGSGAPESSPAGPPADVLLWARILDARESGMAPEALLAIVDAFLAGQPDSALLPEVEVLRLELGAQVWPPAQARAEITAWLRDHPGSPRQGELQALRDALP